MIQSFIRLQKKRKKQNRWKFKVPSRIFLVWHLLPFLRQHPQDRPMCWRQDVLCGNKKHEEGTFLGCSYLHSCSGHWCILVHNPAGTCSRSFQTCWRICDCTSRQLCQWSIHQCLQQEKGCWSDPWEGKIGKNSLGFAWELFCLSIINKLTK